MEVIKSYIRQSSTWTGVFIFAAALGFGVPDSLQAAIPQFVIAGIGLYDAFRKEYVKLKV